MTTFRIEGSYSNTNAIHLRFGTPLQAACQGGQLEAVEILLKWGADPTIEGGHFRTFLDAGAYSGCIDIVQLLLDHGVIVNVYHQSAGSAGSAGLHVTLHAACERGTQKMLELFIAYSADVCTAGGSYGNPLQAASFREYAELVSLLLSNGADANAKRG